MNEKQVNILIEDLGRQIAAASIDVASWKSRTILAEEANQGLAEKIAELEAEAEEDGDV